jgi:hypothetical protein
MVKFAVCARDSSATVAAGLVAVWVAISDANAPWQQRCPAAARATMNGRLPEKRLQI